MVCRDPTAADSFAAIRADRRLGIAIAAMTRIIATTIRSSINENPLFLRGISRLHPTPPVSTPEGRVSPSNMHVYCQREADFPLSDGHLFAVVSCTWT